MPTLFDNLAAALEGNNVSVSISAQGNSLASIGTVLGELATQPPKSIGDLQKTLSEFPLPPLNIGGDFVSTITSLKSAVPTDLSSLTGGLTGELSKLKSDINDDLVNVLKSAIDAAMTIYHLTEIDLRCDDPSSSPASSGGAGSGGQGAGAASGGASGGAAVGAGSTQAPATPTGATATKAAIQQMKGLFDSIPTPFNVESFLELFHRLVQIPQRASLLPLQIPVIDDVLDPLDTLLTWKKMDSAQIRDHIAATLTATDDFIRNSTEAALKPLLGVIGDITPHLQTDTLKQIADDLAARLGELQTAIKSGNLSSTGPIIAAINTLLGQYGGIRAALQTQVLARLPGLSSSLKTLPDDLNDQMSHVLSVMRPNGVLGHLDVFNIPIENASDAGLAEVEKSLSKIVVWIESLVKKIDLSAIKQPIKAVADKAQGAVDALDNSMVELTLEVHKLFGQVESLLNKVDTAAVADEVKSAINKFQTDLIGTLTSLFSPVREALHEIVTTIDSGVGNFKIKDIVDSLQAVITKLNDLLDKGEIKEKITKIHEALDEIEKGIGSLSFGPVADQVIKSIDEITTILHGLDAAKLPAPMMGALQSAVHVLPPDLAPIITPIISEFDTLIKSGPIPLLDAVKSQPEKLLDSVNDFKPASMIGGTLTGPFKEVLDKMNSFKPSSLLAPVQKEIDDLKDRLKEEVNPGKAIKPLEAPFADLLKAFDQLKPEELVKPLDDAIKSVTDAVLSALPIDEALDQVDAVFKNIAEVVGIGEDFAAMLQKGHDVLSGFADGKTQIDGWVTSIMNKIEAISDISPIQQRFTTLAATMDSTRAAGLLFRVNAGTGSLAAALTALDAQGRLTSLVQAHRGCVQSLGVIAASPEKTAVKAMLDKLNPVDPAFSAPYQALADLKRDLTNAKASLQESLSDWDARYHGPDGILATFRPDHVTSADLRHWIEEALGPQIVRPFSALFSLAEQMAGLVARFISQLKKLVNLINAQVSGILTGKDSLGGIIENLKAVVQKLKNFNLGFVTENLKELFEQVRAKLDAVNPAHLREALDEAFKNMLDAINIGIVFPPADVKKLDDDYQQVIDTFKALDPEKVITAIQKEFDEKILPLLNAFNLTPVLKALADKLKSLSGELKTELDKVNEAYKQMLQAVPSGGGAGVSASASISF